MKKSLFVLFALLFIPFLVEAKDPIIVFTPAEPIQGEPVKVYFKGLKNESKIKSFMFDGQKVPVFTSNAKVYAILPIDLNKKVGRYDTTLLLTNNKKVSAHFTVLERYKYKAPLGIPAKLGGNTKQAATNLVTNLSKENALLANIFSRNTKQWKKNFIFPVKDVSITDPYGYSRQTGSYNISHKGTDFKASVGTPIFAMNDGVAELVDNFTIYGGTVVIDHGLGIHTMYMHLSKINVKSGEKITRGQEIGLSGSTGYVEGPHLHLSVRINNISIDPMKFMTLMGE